MSTDTHTADRAAAVVTLLPRLHALSEAQPFHSGWYFKDLRAGVDGGEADRHGHTVVPSASTRKIAILMTALKAVYEGTLSLDHGMRWPSRRPLDCLE